jgi:hypothetical protein
MSDSNERRPGLSPEAQRFVEGLAESFRPDPPSAARSQAFDVALRERIEVPPRPSWWKPALATAAVGAAIGALLSTPSVEPPPETAGVTDTIAAVDTERWTAELVDAADREAELREAELAWEAELFMASDVDDLETTGGDDFLPEDYRAIAGLFLDG